MLHGLELADRAAELFARLGILHRDLEQPLHASGHFSHQTHRRDIQCAIQSLPRVAALGQQFRRNRIKRHLVQLPRSIHGRQVRNVQPSRVRWHDEQRKIPVHAGNHQ